MNWFVAKLPQLRQQSRKQSHIQANIKLQTREHQNCYLLISISLIDQAGLLSCEAQLAIPLNAYTYYMT